MPQTTADTLATCWVCRHRLDFFGPREGYRYFVCSQCQTLQLFPFPSPAELATLYRSKYLVENENERSISPERWQKASLPYQDAILDMVRRHRVRGPLLDFGAGYGFLVDKLEGNGIPAVGLEISEGKLAYCREQSVNVLRGGMDELDRMKGKYAGVVMIAVFEHLSDHRGFLRRLHDCLPPEGVFISLHPTAQIYRYLGDLLRMGRRRKELPSLAGSFAAPWHTTFISVSGMRQLAAETGFTVEDIQPAPQGRLGGTLGLMQVTLEAINRPGWKLLGERWPLVTSHVFLLRKEKRART